MKNPLPASADALSNMTPAQLDGLPYGAIRLAQDGTILSYNMTEGQLTGRDPSIVVGKNFFHDVAPCTDVKAFYGTFLDLIAHRSINRQFDFTFTFTPPMEVRITMMYEQREDTVWVLVDRIDNAGS